MPETEKIPGTQVDQFTTEAYEGLRSRVRRVIEFGAEQGLDSEELVGIVEPMLRESLDEY